MRLTWPILSHYTQYKQAEEAYKDSAFRGPRWDTCSFLGIFLDLRRNEGLELLDELIL
jgi:hypothetical protein